MSPSYLPFIPHVAGQIGNADDDQVEDQNDDQVGDDDHGDIDQSESHGDDIRAGN